MKRGGFPWFDHLNLAEVAECEELEQLYWQGQASWHEKALLRAYRIRRIAAGTPVYVKSGAPPHRDERTGGS